MKDFVVLSMYEIHMASAVLMINGRAVAAAHEERFTRTKLDVGFPVQSALFCLKQAGISPDQVDAVALCNDRFDVNGMANILFKRQALYSIDDWIKENELYWFPKLVQKKEMGSYFELMGGWDRVPDHNYDFTGLDMDADPEAIDATFAGIRKRAVRDLLGIAPEKVVFMPHYMCHHYHAYYSGRVRGDDVAIMHMEGDGGAYNTGVSVPTLTGLKMVGGSSQGDLGRLYQWTTLLMGMKPYHHEYKIMGLAPFATQYEVQRAESVYADLFRTDSDTMSVVYDNKPSDLYFHFREATRGLRFDGIAGALQNLVEKHLAEWFQVVAEKTGKKRFCFGGGVAMNVKANMQIARLDCVEDLFIPLSPGDESNAFGAAYWLTEKHFLENGLDPEDIPPLETPFLGPQHSHEEIMAAVDEREMRQKGFRVETGVGDARVAGMLAEGKVVARMKGPSEFGHRALGNRSILADPSRPGIVEKINNKIKYRDFWMPFCPAVLSSHRQEYMINPKDIRAEYMTMCFPVPEGHHASLSGGLHLGDMTARPQVVYPEVNPDYHELISEFARLTGVHSVINTSFNMHGEPIVGGPDQALHTLLKSELDGVLMEDVLITRPA